MLLLSFLSTSKILIGVQMISDFTFLVFKNLERNSRLATFLNEFCAESLLVYFDQYDFCSFLTQVITYIMLNSLPFGFLKSSCVLPPSIQKLIEFSLSFYLFIISYLWLDFIEVSERLTVFPFSVNQAAKSLILIVKLILIP